MTGFRNNSKERLFPFCVRGAGLICSLCTPARSWLYYLSVSSTCGSDRFIPCMFMAVGWVSSQYSLACSFNSFCVITSFVEEYGRTPSKWRRLDWCYILEFRCKCLKRPSGVIVVKLLWCRAGLLISLGVSPTHQPSFTLACLVFALCLVCPPFGFDLEDSAKSLVKSAERDVSGQNLVPITQSSLLRCHSLLPGTRGLCFMAVEQKAPLLFFHMDWFPVHPL